MLNSSVTRGYQKLSPVFCASFCKQLAALLGAGISPAEGLELMREDSESEERVLLSLLLDSYNESYSLATAFESYRHFPHYLVHMTKLGEETGTLDKVMDALSRHYTREDEISRGIRSAVTYPAILIGMMLVVIAVLLVEVLPIFNQVFLQLGTEMSGFGRVLMDMGKALRNYSLVFTLIIAVLIILGIYVSSSKGIKLRRKIQQSFSLTRNIQEKTSACRLADAMALSLKSGIAPLQSLAFARELIDDEYFSSKLDKCQSAMEMGEDLGPALLSAGIYSGLQARMISIGHKTGTLDAVMDDIAASCQSEIDEKIASVLAVLEPSLVALLSVLVGGILLSVMLPLLGIMSSI